MKCKTTIWTTIINTRSKHATLILLVSSYVVRLSGKKNKTRLQKDKSL